MHYRKKFKCPWHITEIKELFYSTFHLKMALEEYARICYLALSFTTPKKTHVLNGCDIISN